MEPTVRASVPHRLRRTILLVLGCIVPIVIGALLFIAMFPFGLLKGQVESRLARSTGQAVTIGSLQRDGLFSFKPTVIVGDLHIPQATWAGRGDLARIRTMRVRFPVLSLLAGRFEPEDVAIEGARLTLVRDANGRRNWDVGGDRSPDEDGSRPNVDRLTVTDSVITYRDARRDRDATLRIAADTQRGVSAVGRGSVRGAPVTIAAKGAAIAGAGSRGAWPFSIDISGDAVGLALSGRMDRALDFRHFSARAKAHGKDLALLDAIIEAGLPGTQPVRVTADVRHDGRDWTISALTGTIGRSDIAGHARIVKHGDRTRIDGVISANRFDFEDLSSDEGRRKAAAKLLRTGDRLVPDTPIDLTKLARTDGRLEISARQLLWPGSSPFRALRGTLELDHSRLTVRPVALHLTRGLMDGTIVVDQRGRPAPLLRIDLQLKRARLIDFFPDAAIDGSLTGRFRLAGTGQTIRTAVGRADGSIALVARDGGIPSRTASLLGEDVGRGLTASGDDRSVLRCVIARFDVKGGIARANPVIIDSSRAGTHGHGSIRLADERLMLSIKGAPKKASLLRLTEPITVGGTIKHPRIEVPRVTKTARGVLRMLGDAITGEQGDLASDADCNGLAARALR